MPFKELAKIALLGTENAAFPESLLQELADLGLRTEAPPPVLLAESAAVFSQIKKAGFPLLPYTGKLPEAAAGGGENECSLKSVRHLQLILDGKFPAIFPEFLHHLLENGKRLPTSLLPNLLSRDDINEWWHLIEPALGPTGQWLLAQHPKWRIRTEKPHEKNWSVGDKIQRMALFKHWRATAPDLAAQHLLGTWHSESIPDKKAFLKEMAVGLSPADEPLLDTALADSRKEIRKEAIPLLAKLPFSAFAERMFQRALDTMHYQKGNWHFNIPDEPDAAATKDGIVAIDPSWKGGAKSGYLGQVFSKIPPSRWELHFEADPLEVLKIFTRTEWSAVLQRALALAAIYHEDEKWAAALTGFWFENENAPVWTEEAVRPLLQLVPPAALNQLSMQYLRERKGLPEEDSPLFRLLLANDAPWENELSKAIISRLQEWVANSKTMDWNALHYKLFLDMTALRCSTSLFPFLEKGWRTTAPLWYNWEKLVADMLNTVMFRREMALELGA